MDENKALTTGAQAVPQLFNSQRSRRRKRVNGRNNPSVSKITLSPSGLRKSLRSRVLSTRNRSNGVIGNKSTIVRLKSRRNVFKQQPTKLCPAPPLFRIVQSLRYLESVFTVGDVVSVVDMDSGIYYAQLRSLAVDAVGDGSCVLTWLIPTREQAGAIQFKPENFIIGMEEDVLRDISCCNFVCHCPADYFRPLASPYSVTFC